MDNEKLHNGSGNATPKSDKVLSDDLLAEDLDDDEVDLDDLPV